MWDNQLISFEICQRDMFENDYLPNVYQSVEIPNAHKLAVVYLVMAMGVMFDLEKRAPRKS